VKNENTIGFDMSEELVWNKEKHLAPFDDKGNLLGYNDWKAKEYRDVTKPFFAHLKYVGYGRGRSSIVFEWQDVISGAMYEMFVSDLDDLLRRPQAEGISIKGHWQVVKKGANYGIKLLSDQE
jgi:hypothetical protein